MSRARCIVLLKNGRPIFSLGIALAKLKVYKPTQIEEKRSTYYIKASLTSQLCKKITYFIYIISDKNMHFALKSDYFPHAISRLDRV
jgi:hypothetical protein